MSGTEVTARAVGAPTSSTDRVVITDDYVLVTDGRCHQDRVQVHHRADGGRTHVITVRTDPPPTPSTEEPA